MSKKKNEELAIDPVDPVDPEMPSDEELRAHGHLPTMFYRCPGPHARNGGTFDYVGIDSVAKAKEYLDEGWYPSLPEAISAFDGK